MPQKIPVKVLSDVPFTFMIKKNVHSVTRVVIILLEINPITLTKVLLIYFLRSWYTRRFKLP